MQHLAVECWLLTSEKNTEDKLTSDEFQEWKSSTFWKMMKRSHGFLREEKPWAFPEFFCATLDHKCLHKFTVEVDHKMKRAVEKAQRNHLPFSSHTSCSQLLVLSIFYIGSILAFICSLVLKYFLCLNIFCLHVRHTHAKRRRETT